MALFKHQKEKTSALQASTSLMWRGGATCPRRIAQITQKEGYNADELLYESMIVWICPVNVGMIFFATSQTI